MAKIHPLPPLPQHPRASCQRIDDLRLELCRVVCPIAVDFPGATAESTTGRCAPGMNRLMRGRELVIATGMRGHGDRACRRLGTDYLAFALKGLHHLNAEVDVHCCLTMRGMMIEE